MTIIDAPTKTSTSGTISHQNRTLDTTPTTVMTAPVITIRLSGELLMGDLRSHATNPAAMTSRMIKPIIGIPFVVTKVGHQPERAALAPKAPSILSDSGLVGA